MSRSAHIRILFACLAAAISVGMGPTRAEDRRPVPVRPAPRPVSTAAAEKAARDYLRKVFPDFAAKSLSIESHLERPASHPLGEEVSVRCYEVLAANGARTGNVIAVRVKRGRQVFLESERREPVPPEAAATPAITASRAQAIAVGALGSKKTHVASVARLVWVAGDGKHGKAVNRLVWRVPIAVRPGGRLTAQVAVDAQNGASLGVYRYR